MNKPQPHNQNRENFANQFSDEQQFSLTEVPNFSAETARLQDQLDNKAQKRRARKTHKLYRQETEKRKFISPHRARLRL